MRSESATAPFTTMSDPRSARCCAGPIRWRAATRLQGGVEEEEADDEEAKQVGHEVIGEPVDRIVKHSARLLPVRG